MRYAQRLLLERLKAASYNRITTVASASLSCRPRKRSFLPERHFRPQSGVGAVSFTVSRTEEGSIEKNELMGRLFFF